MFVLSSGYTAKLDLIILHIVFEGGVLRIAMGVRWGYGFGADMGPPLSSCPARSSQHPTYNLNYVYLLNKPINMLHQET